MKFELIFEKILQLDWTFGNNPMWVFLSGNRILNKTLWKLIIAFPLIGWSLLALFEALIVAERDDIC
jgi:hypothetical protein